MRLAGCHGALRDNFAMGVFGRLPFWIRGCIAGSVIGSLMFVTFVALLTLTPLYFAVAAFTASGVAGTEMFGALALSSALLGGWVGGLFGMPIGAIAGRAYSQKPVWSVPGWAIGAIVTAYIIVPTFVDPTATIASDPLVTRVLVYAIMVGLGALVGLIVSGIRRVFRRS